MFSHFRAKVKCGVKKTVCLELLLFDWLLFCVLFVCFVLVTSQCYLCIVLIPVFHRLYSTSVGVNVAGSNKICTCSYHSCMA